MEKNEYVIGGAIIAIVLIFAVLMAYSGPQEVKLTAADNGSKLELIKGQVLVITLEANPSTGYTWEIAELDEQVLRQVGEIEFELEKVNGYGPGGTPWPGTGGVQIIRFEVVNAGQTTLKLVYHRPWVVYTFLRTFFEMRSMVQISPTCDIKTFRVAQNYTTNYTLRSTLPVLFDGCRKIPSPTCEKNTKSISITTIIVVLVIDMKKLIEDIIGQKNGFRFSKPWRYTDQSLGIIVPIIREKAPNRNYITLQEATEEAIQITDSGSINKVNVVSKSKAPVFIRMGSMLGSKGGASTQPRAVNSSIVIMPQETTVDLPDREHKIEVSVMCIHASQPISRGTGLILMGLAPEEVEQPLAMKSSQSHVWGGVREFARVSEHRHRLGGVARLSDDLISNMRQVERFKKDVEDVLKAVPCLEDQVGMVILDLDGVIGIEVFDSPKSWAAFNEDVTKKYGDVLAEKQDEPLFELREDRIQSKIVDFMRKLTACEGVEVFSVKTAKTLSLKGDVIGEYTTIGKRTVHLLGMRTREEVEENPRTHLPRQEREIPSGEFLGPRFGPSPYGGYRSEWARSSWQRRTF